MNLKSQKIFEKVLKENQEFYPLFQKKTILAYSGGKDSNILLEFYQFLLKEKISKRISLFHLNHRIRDNESQELEIKDFMKSTGLKSYYKKKILNSIL